MRDILKKIIYLFGFFLVFLLPLKIQAQENQPHFDIALSAEYQVRENGSTLVTQNFTITNRSPQFFVEQYSVIVGSNQLSGVKVLEKGEIVPHNVNVSGNQTNINISFPNELVGQGKQRKFALIYESTDLSIVNGNALEVSIPKLDTQNNFSNYEVVVKTPLKFGGPSKTSPAKPDWIATNQEIITSFKDLNEESVVIFYGWEQFYDLTLRYNLKNTTDTPGLMQVALPPDTQQQKMQYLALQPEPQEMKLDLDGNWIATYKLNPAEELQVNLQAKAKTSLDILPDVPVAKPSSEYLQAQKYWPTGSSEIKKITQELNDVRSIYYFVVDKLNYNYQKIGQSNERLGADQVLDNPQNSSCQEFTDLFVTLARAKQIPSRRLTGYAFTQNNVLRPLSLVEDVLHTWPEYYDNEKQQWVSVDPTWENTTGGINYFDQFDLSHIVFAINGQSSEKPYPAGAYKLPSQETKDVEVTFAKDFVEEPFEAELSLIPIKLYGLIWTGHYNLKIKNLTGQAWYNLNLEFKNDQPDLTITSKTQNLVALLPFQTQTVPLVVQQNKWQAGSNQQIEVIIKDQPFSLTVKPSTYVNQYFNNPLGLLALGCGLVVLTLTAGSLLVFRRK